VATRVLGVVVLAFSLVNAAGAVSVLNPGLFAGPVTAASARSSNVRDDGGVQVVETVQGDFGYRPADAVVYAGEPVRWVITMEARSCASLMALDSLGLGTVELNYPTTVLEFTPSAPGVLNYSCAMGMFRGSFQVIERPA
jgi:plastocyanin domain-containing protein